MLEGTQSIDRNIGAKILLQSEPINNSERIWYTTDNMLYAAEVKWSVDRNFGTELYDITDWVF